MAEQLKMYKFDGAGNDFVLLDIRGGDPGLSREEISHLCHRRFGIGADGLMTLGNAEGYDFEMRYYNSDGGLGSMCGNGGRCIAMFAKLLGLGREENGRTYLHFLGYDGSHDAVVLEWDEKLRKGVVRLGMRDVAKNTVRRCLDGCFLDTGSPHYVQQVTDLEHYDVFGEGRRLRHIKEEFPEGANVDFIEMGEDGRLHVRTYERGVEEETWACGTGVTACALVTGMHRIKARGGDFVVDFEEDADRYSQVWLTGPVSLNFVTDETFGLVRL